MYSLVQQHQLISSAMLAMVELASRAMGMLVVEILMFWSFARTVSMTKIETPRTLQPKTVVMP